VNKLYANISAACAFVNLSYVYHNQSDVKVNVSNVNVKNAYAYVNNYHGIEAKICV